MKVWLTPAERQSLALVLSLVALGYALVGWRQLGGGVSVAGLDSLDLAFARQGAAMTRQAPGLDPDSLVESLWFPIDLNAADSLQLLRLPGVGPGRASAILALRRQQGVFRSVEELLAVRGIGPATLAAMRDKLFIKQDRQDSPGGPQDTVPAAPTREDPKP